MEILFEGPIFYDEEDERIFFEWIYGLTSYNQVKGSGEHLILNLKEPVDDETVILLLVLFGVGSLIKPLLDRLDYPQMNNLYSGRRVDHPANEYP